MSTAETMTILDKIRTRGYWSVVIRPTTFEEARVEYQQLSTIIERCSVGYGGLSYPYFARANHPRSGPDWIEQAYEHGEFLESWRFHTSGLYLHYFDLAGEWRDHSDSRPADPGWQPGRSIYYLNTVYYFVEIFEFASRLAQSDAGGNWMRVEVAIKNLQGQQLISEGRHFRPDDDYKISAPEWSDRWEGSQIDLITKPRELAAQFAQQFFARFHLNLSLDVLKTLQESIGR